MSKINLFFIYEKNKYEFKKSINSLNDAVNLFISMLNKNSSELYFIYNGKPLTFNVAIKFNCFYLKNINKPIVIFVFNLFKNNNNIMQVNDIICPKCKNFGMVDINRDKISINNCINGHKTNDLSFNDFLESQNIEEKDINCKECGNNKKLYGSYFYICSCNNYLCPLCIYKHVTHKKIFYDSKYFQCINHALNFISYCQICKKNLCTSCELEHLNEYPNHKINLYKEKLFNQNIINLIKSKIEEEKNKINSYKSQLSQVKIIFNEIFKYISNNIEGYLQFNEKILECSKKVHNFESIINLENYNKNNLLIIKEINDFFQKDIKNKLQFIVDSFDKVFNNEMTIVYKNNKDKIKLFGKNFVENNKKNCYLIINEKKYDLMEYYNFKNENNDNNIQIKLVEEKIVNDFSYMFSDCTCLTSLIEGYKWNTSLVNNMNHMFYNCSSLILLEGINKWITSNVQNMSYAFYNCSLLKSLPDISEWNISNVTDISYMFYNCSSLLFLPDISKWNTINIVNMSYFCCYCSSLISIKDITKWDANNIRNMNYSFSYCSSLEYFPDIYKWKVPNIKNLNILFSRSIPFPSLSYNSNNINENKNEIYNSSKSENKEKNYSLNSNNNKTHLNFSGKPLLIHQYIRNYLRPNKFEVKKEVEDELLELCNNHFYNREGIILKNNFKYLIQLSDSDIFNLIFEIFGRKKEKNDIISFNDIKYLYVSFITNNPKVKAVVIAFLLFQNKENLVSNEIRNNIFSIFKGDQETQNILLKEYVEIIMNKDKIASQSKKNNKIYNFNFNIKNYINKILENKDYIQNFHFIQLVLGSSVYKFNLIKNGKINYICDCAKVMSKINIEDNLESMKNVFESITAETNKVLYLNNFKKILEDSKIHKNIINLVLDYLKKSTQKDYCCFNDLKHIFSNLNYSLPLIDKKKFFFKIISSINDIDKNDNKLTYNQINKYLNIDYNKDNDKNHIDDNFDLFNEEDFMKDKTFEDMFNKLYPYLENFGLLPYLIFKVKTDDKTVKRKLIKYVLKNENIDNYEKYLENKFEEYDLFYAVNIKFWNKLMDDNKEAPDYINNSEISEEINIVKREDQLIEQITKLQQNSQVQQKKGNEKDNKDGRNEGDKNIIQEKNNEENKTKDNNKETKENKEKFEKKNIEIITKLGKLKKGLTYKKDFILLCGQLYQIIKNNYRIDYIIKLTKMRTIIDLNKNNDEEKNDDINNEKLVKEKLDEFIIDENKGFISKIVKYKNGNNENNDNKYIINELDFYPIQVYQKSFGLIVRAIENAKLMYDKLEKVKKFYELTPKEQRIIKKEREKEIENLRIKIQKYYDEKQIIEINRSKEFITRDEYENQLRELQNKYEDIFQKREKNQNDYEVDITMTDFIDNLVKYKNTLLLEKKDEISFYPRYKTFKDIKKFILSNNKFLKEKKFDIYYFLFSSGTLFQPNENYTFGTDGNNFHEFIIIIVDIYSDKGESFLQLLKDKEKEKKGIKDDILKQKVKNIEKEILIKKNKEKDKEQRLNENNENKKYEKNSKEEIIKQSKIKKENKEINKNFEKNEKEKTEKEKDIFPPYGIKDYGNTSYINSVNQIFFNLPIFQKIFSNPQFEYIINQNKQTKYIKIMRSFYQIKPSQIEEKLKILIQLINDNSQYKDANKYLKIFIEKLHNEFYLKKDNINIIDIIFSFLLNSHLTCSKCFKTIINLEINYIFDLPLLKIDLVEVEINLYRLPFIYKLYYDKINKKFEDYINKDDNKNLSIVHNLWNYYKHILTIEEKKQQTIKLHFIFSLDRRKEISYISKILRQIKPLELEPENIIETFNNEKITEYKVEHLTDFITYSKEKDVIIYPDYEIDKYVNIEDKIILNIYEVLNTNGMKKLFEEENKNININLYTYLYKNTSLPNINTYIDTLKDSCFIKGNKDNNIYIEDISTSNNSGNTINENNMKIKKETFNILAFKEQMVIFPKEEITKDTRLSRKISTEFAIPIFHYWRSNKKSTFLFRNFYHITIKEFPVQYIILSNIYNINAKQLYEYIWNLNIIYMNHPNMNTKEFWWNNLTNENLKEDDKINKDNINIKKCYPFVLRYTEICEKTSNNNNNLIHCPLCPWYSFCPGCIIDPRSDIKNLSSKNGIVLDWCYSFVIEEFQSFNFDLYKEIQSDIIFENLPNIDKKQNIQYLKDCFDLFYNKQNLKDPLYCQNCRKPEIFYKQYSLNTLPNLLILSLKRFIFEKDRYLKLKQMIKYPLYNFQLGDKQYDLYGVVNYKGNINSGNYNAFIKVKNEWLVFDDEKVYSIEEKNVVDKKSCILFYISKNSFLNSLNNDFLKDILSFTNDINNQN